MLTSLREVDSPQLWSTLLFTLSVRLYSTTHIKCLKHSSQRNIHIEETPFLTLSPDYKIIIVHWTFNIYLQTEYIYITARIDKHVFIIVE